MLRTTRVRVGAVLATASTLALTACGVIAPPSTPAGGGSYTYTSTSVPSSAGFGGGTVYYPTNATGARAVISLAPGFTENASTLKDWGPTLASNGFVTIIINTTGALILPTQRSTEQLQALAYVVNLGKTAGNALSGKVDANRRAVGGHSMGGGGTLESTLTDPTLRAAVAMAPWDTNSSIFGADAVPTLVWGCQNDVIAPQVQHSTPFYNAIPNSTKKMYLSVKGADHYCVNSSSGASGQAATYTVAFYRYFLDGDTSQLNTLCGTAKPTAGAVLNAVTSTCPF